MILIFDLDGTLINSKKRHSLLMRRILESNGIIVPTDFEDSYMDFKDSGNNNKKYLTTILNLPLDLASKICTEWVNEIESDEMIKYDTLYEDTIEVLEKLNKNNTIIYLSSRSKEDTLIKSLKDLKIYDYANEIYVTDPKDGSNGKSEIIKKLKEKEKDNIIIIGDTEVDYDAARNANIKSYILNRGFRNKEYWNNIGLETFNSLKAVSNNLVHLTKK